MFLFLSHFATQFERKDQADGLTFNCSLHLIQKVGKKIPFMSVRANMTIHLS